MLIFDVTNKASFDKLDCWLEEFHENGGKGAVLTVVGNKVSDTCNICKLSAYIQVVI
jgi:hypothetical protein